MNNNHLKESLVRKKLNAVFESVQKMKSMKKKELAESFGHRGLLHSGSHSKAVMDLELEALKELLKSKLDIDLNIFFKTSIPYTKKHEEFLKRQIEQLYEARLKTTKKELNEYQISRRIPLSIHEYEREANIILSNLIKKIEIIILENQISMPELLDRSIDQLIKDGESTHVEFKSTFQWDINAECKNKLLRMEVIETLAAFNNTDGGYLLIGVANDGTFIGLEKDYSTFRKNKDSDTFLQTLTHVIENKISQEFASLASISIMNKEELDICLIKVNPGEEPAWVIVDEKELFFVRVQNTTVELSPSKAANWIKKKWPN